MATHCSVLPGKSSWTKEPGGLQFMGVTKSRTRLSDSHTHVNATVAINTACNVLTFRCLARHKIPGFSLTKCREMSPVCSVQPSGCFGFSQ